MANPSNDPAQLLASLLDSGQAMPRPFAPEPGKSDPMGDFIAATQQIAGLQQEFWNRALAYWSAVPSAAGVSQVSAETADRDPRFSADAWRNDPRFDLIRRSYLAYSNFLQSSVESAQIDEKTKAQMRHGMRQFIDAVSPSNFLVTQILAGDNTFVLGASGHIAGVINPPAKKKRNFWMAGEAGPDPERWLETARSVPGSWWPMWSEWLAQQAGNKVPARVKLGNRSYRKIESAPGRYVKAKAE